MPLRLRALAPLALALCAACSTSRDPDLDLDGPLEMVSIAMDNDTFTGSDNNYTNGIVVGWRGGEHRAYTEDSRYRRWIEFWSFLPAMDDATCDTYAAWSVGHELYSPDDITVAVPDADDQPYAAVFFVDSTLLARSDRVTHSWNLRLGLVGPSALGEELQSGVHQLIDVEDPAGWDTQIPDEPVVNVDYAVAYELLHAGRPGAVEARFVPLAGAGAGTYFTGAAGAMYGEFGWNLPDSVSLVSLRRGVDPALELVSPRGGWSVSLFAGGGGFAVANYLPLDGNAFRSGPSVKSEPFVAFASVGVALRYDRWRLGYRQTLFTDTFQTQREAVDYGTLSLSYSY
jgi:lipid A 3-O-deacylase